MSEKRRSLRGNRVFITGVGPRITDENGNEVPGIGERVVYALVEKGAKVFLTGIDKYELTRVASAANRIGARTGGHAYCMYCDVRDLEQVEYAVKCAVDRMGGLDTFFANAGIAKFLVIRDGDPKLFRQHVEVNFVGAFNTIRACAPYIEHSNGYGLVNDSQAANVALPGMAPGYSATKAAGVRLGEGFNLELQGTGARCGSLLMAEHESPMEANFDLAPAQTMMEDNPWLKAFHRKRDPNKAVAAIVRGIERRSLYIDAPPYAALARYFPSITNWIVRLISRNTQRAMEVARAEVASPGN